MRDDDPGRHAGRASPGALAELAAFQQEDFEGLFEAMAGWPVTIRLLDPPLHEFVPARHEVQKELDVTRSRPSTARARGGVRRLERLLERVASLQETNPMLGTRGCRLGILYPEIYEMQTHAISRAGVAVRERSGRRPGSR